MENILITGDDPMEIEISNVTGLRSVHIQNLEERLKKLSGDMEIVSSESLRIQIEIAKLRKDISEAITNRR